jgi:serine/threonine protein kinase
MDEVNRARDTKLNRDVALKILPDAFASDPDRLARFTPEAQTLAPSIIRISRTFMDSKNRTACAPSSWNLCTARTSRSA